MKKLGNKFETGLFLKDTFNGLSTNYNSTVSNKNKFNFIQSLVIIAFRICSSFHEFSAETTFLRYNFQQNGFLFID